jgi:chemotaxis protein histidine kinase CheA
MSRDAAGKPSVATFADHEVISPPNKLRRAASIVETVDPNDDPVARAEAALAELSSTFSNWMEEEVERLEKARRAVKAKGVTKPTCEALFYAAHDIKGHAATFGFPWVAASAESLCWLIEHTPDIARIPIALVDQHVDAVRAIIRESARTDIAPVAGTLIKRLREVTIEFLTQENRDDPDALAGIFGPPLVPDNG